MVCRNASSMQKFPLLLIRKFKNSKALKKINYGSLLVAYCSEKNTRMNNKIFEHFIPGVTKVITVQVQTYRSKLSSDNAPSHPATNEWITGDITVMFSPSNVIALV